MPNFNQVEGQDALQYFKPADMAPGEEFEGILIERWVKTFDDGGTQTTYKMFTKLGETIGVNGTYQLDDLMAYVADGAYVLIRYLGKVLTKNNRPLHTFEVHLADEDSETADLRSRAPKPKPQQQQATPKQEKPPTNAKSLFGSKTEIPF